MSIRLFDSNGHSAVFDATVLSCVAVGEEYEIELDQTAFYPHGGGQAADGGTISGVAVTDVREDGRRILHAVSKPFEVGTTVHGEIDWPMRIRRMQNHTGEHLVCGIAHSLFGYENVGFHMGTLGVTADFSGPLTEKQVRNIEYIANEAVAKNVEVRSYYPSKDELKTLQYRSKLDLTENVRIVTIDGYDACACCAPHVLRTGEIGLVKILSHENYKGGTRMLLRCGLDALEDYVARCAQISAISASLCAKECEVAQAVEQLKAENIKLKFEIEKAERAAAKQYESRLKNCEGNACVFAGDFSFDSLREIVNTGVKMCGGVFAAFGGENGCYRYVLGSTSVNLSAFVKGFNAALNGRGGGKPNMVQGSINAEKNEIIAFLGAEEQ